MNIVMIASSYYPISDVSSIRIHSYCRSLASKGNTVTVFVVYPPNDILNYSGMHDGVYYDSFSYQVTSQKSFLKKAFSRIRGANKVALYIKRNKVKVVLSYHDNLFTNILLKLAVLFVSRKKIAIIIDKTEYPYGYSRMGKVYRFIARFRLRFYDGFIVISEELEKWYASINKNVYLLPMTISPNRYEGVKKINHEPYIALTFGTHNRDGLFDSLQAYNIYRQISPLPYYLMLIGDINKLFLNHPETKKIQEYIIENNLEKFVVIKGVVPINEVPELLYNAQILLTTSQGYSSGGFPTKLGEYMLSGVPVVATDVGEISVYVKNGNDILLSKPYDYENIANHILILQNDKFLAKRIGENALQTALKVFNADTYYDSLLNYIKKNCSCENTNC